MMTNITGRLENWYYYPLWNVIWGNIYDDSKKRFFNGEWIHTSDIPNGRSTNSKFKEGLLIETLNSKYLLGKPRVEEVQTDE